VLFDPLSMNFLATAQECFMCLPISCIAEPRLTGVKSWHVLLLIRDCVNAASTTAVKRRRPSNPA
jgi:hypothetical protein